MKGLNLEESSTVKTASSNFNDVTIAEYCYACVLVHDELQESTGKSLTLRKIYRSTPVLNAAEKTLAVNLIFSFGRNALPTLRKFLQGDHEDVPDDVQKQIKKYYDLIKKNLKL